MIEIHVKGLNDSSKELLKICSIFDSQPYFDFLQLSQRFYEQLIPQLIKMIKPNGFLDCKKLLQNGLLFAQLSADQQFIASNSYLQLASKDKIYIKEGQFDSQNKLTGLGRKISIHFDAAVD